MPDFASGLVAASDLASKPLSGVRVGVITETTGEGVSAGISAAISQSLAHMESLGAAVEEVRSRQAPA